MKKKLIAGALALSMVLAGTGYAYWTDSLNITTSATTGNMDVQFMDLGLLAQYSNENAGWSIIDGIGSGSVSAKTFERGTADYNAIASEEGLKAYAERIKNYNKISFDAELVGDNTLSVSIGDYKNTEDATANSRIKVSDKIEISLENIYPGYAQAFRTDIGNVGNIAAKLSNLVVTTAGDTTGNLNDMVGVALMGFRECCPNDTNEKIVGFAENFKKSDTFSMGGVDFVRLSALTKMDFSKIDFGSDVLYVEPNSNRMDFDFAVAMDPDATGTYTTGSTKVNNTANSDSDSMSKAISINIEFKWDQFNVKDADEKNTIAPNVLKKQNVGQKVVQTNHRR